MPTRFLLLLLFAAVAWSADRPAAVLDATNRPNLLVNGDRMTIPDASGDRITIEPGIQTAARVLSIPVLTGAATITVLSEAQTLTGLKTFTGGLTITTADLTITDRNVVLGTTTGTQLGTSALQKLSAFGATPIVQPSGNALTALSNLGWIASPTLAASDISSGTLATARGGTGISNATGSLTFDGATTISGGGTLALGTFTATIPATGTVALRGVSNTFTADQIISAANGLALTAATGTTLQIDSTSANLALNSAGGATFAGNLNANGSNGVQAKPLATAGISLSPNAATGNFTLSISPANLTANRRTTLPDADLTITGGGTVALGGFTLTVPATGTAALLGTANAFTAVNTFSNTTRSTGISNGSIITNGGIGVSQQSYMRGVATSSDVSALVAEYYANQSVDPAAFRFGLNFLVSMSGATAGNSSTTVGIQSNIANNTAGITHADCRAFSAILDTGNATAAITNGYGYYFRNGTNTGTSAAKHAFYTEAVTGGTVNYAFRSAGAGLVSISDTTSASSSTVGAVTIGNAVPATSVAIGSGIVNAGGSMRCHDGTNIIAWMYYSGSNGIVDAPQGSLLLQAGAATKVTVGNAVCDIATGVQLRALDTTDSTTTATGGLTANGGAGFAKQLTARNLSAIHGTITAAQATIAGTVTWNEGSTSFTALDLNVTNTASGTSSLLANLQIGGTSRFNLSKFGVANFVAVTTTTATADQTFRLGNNSSGTPAAGYGFTALSTLKSSTTADQNAAQVDTTWVVATHASRTARQVYSVYDTAAREGFRIEASGTAPMIGFLGANAVARPSTTGEATGFTAGAGTAVNDASTFTGNVGATAYRLNDIVKHLKNLGLIAP